MSFTNLYIYNPLLNHNNKDVGKNVMIKKGLRYDECTDDVIYAEQLLVGEIGDIAGDLAALNRSDYIVGIDNVAAGKVDYAHTVAHFCNAFGVYHTLGRGQGRNMKRNVVAQGEQLVITVSLGNIARKRPGGVNRYIRIAADDLHSE